MKKFYFFSSRVFMVALFIGITIFISCSGSSKPVTIDYWTTQTQADRQKVIGALVDTFQALNPSITVNVVPIDENDLPTSIEVIVNGNGTLPDIAEVPSGPVVSFGAADLIDTKSVSEIVEKTGKSSFFEGALRLVASQQDKNVLYGVPYHGWLQGIWYRKDWFAQDGLAPPNTWENILAAAKKYYQPSKNQYGILVGTKAEVFSEQVYTPIALSDKAGLFNADGTLVFNSPQTKEVMTYYKNLAQYNPPGPQTWRARDYYLQGSMAMFFYSTYIMDDLAIKAVAESSLTAENFENLKGSNFDPDLVKNTGFEAIISKDDSASYGTLVAVTLFKNKDKKKLEAAKKLLEFLLEKDNYITFLHMAPGGMLPMREGIADTDEFLNDPKGVYKLYGADAIKNIVSGFRKIKTFNIVDGNQIENANIIFSKQIIPQMIYEITQEGKDINVAIAEAEKKMQAIVNEN